MGAYCNSMPKKIIPRYQPIQHIKTVRETFQNKRITPAKNLNDHAFQVCALLYSIKAKKSLILAVRFYNISMKA